MYISSFDPVMVLMLLWATLIVALGAFHANRAPSPPSNKSSSSGNNNRQIPSVEDEVQLLNVAAAVQFLIVSSLMLTFLYFFIDYVAYFLIGFYMIGAEHALVYFVQPKVHSCFGNCDSLVVVTIPIPTQGRTKIK
eukprot:UN29514